MVYIHTADRSPNLQIADYLMDPLCRGVFAGSAHHLSMQSCFPVIHQLEEKHGSLLRGMLFLEKCNFSERMSSHDYRDELRIDEANIVGISFVMFFFQPRFS